MRKLSASSAVTPSPEHPVARAIQDYLDWHQLRGSSKSHQRDVACRLKALQSLVPDGASLTDIAREHCVRLLRSVQEQGCKANTQVAYFRVMEAFFNWLVAEERLERSPMERVPKPKLAQEPIQPLTQDELAVLLAAPDPSEFTGCRDRLFIALLADTGLRLSEALSVRIRDLDPKQRSIAVKGKGGKVRTVFYGEAVAGLLKPYLKRRGGEDPEDQLFVNSLGEPLWKCTMSKRLREHGRKAGIQGKRVSPHTLRHTFAVSWLLGGGDSFSLQRLMGHSTAAMTERYVNFTSCDLGRLHRTLSPLDRLAPMPAEKVASETRRKRLR